MAGDKKTPHITPDLIEHLERIAPDRCPTSEMSNREVWMAAGAAKLVRHLKSVMDSQAKQALQQGS